MASAKVLEAKKAEVAALSERFQNACAGVLVDYKGINVADDTALRAELRKEGIEVISQLNTLKVNSIATNIAKKLVDSFPEQNFNYSELFTKKRRNPKLGSFVFIVEYSFTPNSVYCSPPRVINN